MTLPLVVLSLAGAGVAAPASAAGWTAPVFERSIGARGEAAVYPWGMEYNPVSHEILVGDYWNFQIRRYTTDGKALGSFFRPASQRKGQPYTISVDPRNGDIYVPELGDGKPRGYIARYDKGGTYLGEIHVDARYWVWSHIDAGGHLWLADAHLSTPSTARVWEYSLPDGRLMGYFTGAGSTSSQLGSELHGITTDSAGNVYVADAQKLVIRVYQPNGVWLRNIGGPGRGPGQFTGDLRGIDIDRVSGLLYVVDAEASQIDVFTTAGAYVRSWGSEGFGAGQFADGGRELTIDDQGDVYVADYGGYRFHKFSPTGDLLETFPDPAAGPPPGGLAQVRDVAVDAVDGALWVADPWNNRFQKFAADGTFLGAWGYRNSHPPYGMDYPRAVAVDPATRNVWVSNTRDHVIRVYDKDGNYRFTIGSGADSASAGSFRWVFDVEFFQGKAYVTDYNSGYWKVLDAATGQELAAVARRNNGIAVDPATGLIYVVSAADRAVTVYNQSLQYVSSFGSSSVFSSPTDIDIAGGVVYVTDSALARVDAFTTGGSFLGAWGSRGSGLNQFNAPSGISHDGAGNLYIADAGNDRVVKYQPGGVLPGGDVAAPTIVVTAPTMKATVVATSPVVISGSVSDDTRVLKVEVALRDRVSGLWWDAASATWRTGKAWNLAAVAGSPSDATFRSYFTGLAYGGSYATQGRATDIAGHTAMTALVNFAVRPKG